MIRKRRRILTSSVRVTFELPTELREHKCSLVGDFNEWDSSVDIFNPKDGFKIAKDFEIGETHEFLYLSDTGEYFQEPESDGIRQSDIGTMNSTVASQPARVEDFLKRVRDRLTLIGELRDSALVAVGGLYLVGYVVWAINARVNDLGLLPALEFQYLIAGIVPVCVGLLTWAAFKGIFWFRRRLPVWLGPNVKGWRWFLRQTILSLFSLEWCVFFVVVLLPVDLPILDKISENVVFAIMITTFFLPPVEDKENTKVYALIDEMAKRVSCWWSQFAMLTESWPSIVRPLVFLVQLLIFVPVAFVVIAVYAILVGMFSPGVFLSGVLLRFYRTMSLLWVILTIVLLSLMGIAWFVTEAYPKIPQEFGGVRPRCAYLDIEKDQLSEEMREAIVPVNAIESDHQVVRSKQVSVLFSSRDFMLVRPYVGQQTAGSQPIYEIKESSVSAVTWCD